MSRPDHIAIKLIGKLEAESLQEVMDQLNAETGRVALEMDELTLVDVDAVRFLIDCEARGIQLRGCSGYIREWIARERENPQ